MPSALLQLWSSFSSIALLGFGKMPGMQFEVALSIPRSVEAFQLLRVPNDWQK